MVKEIDLDVIDVLNPKVRFGEVVLEHFEQLTNDELKELWYNQRELKHQFRLEVQLNKDLENNPPQKGSVPDNREEMCCWRGLESLLEGDQRKKRIRAYTRYIVNYHKEQRSVGITDWPGELRVVSKERTKMDRDRAKNMGGLDAKEVKEKGSKRGNGIFRALSKDIKFPRSWSPKPNKHREGA